MTTPANNHQSARLQVAAIATIYYARSHADVIATKFMKGMSTDEGFFPPEMDLTSLYIDHILETDIGVNLAAEHGVHVYPSIRQALRSGSEKLSVDGILLIGEHGDYAWNEKGRHLYPRKYLFEQIAGVCAESGRAVPVFCDKHFSYNFADARWMWDRADQLGIPLMAGSCLPLAWRRPWLEYPRETLVEEALAVGYGGIEAYGFHTLETLQCMIERRHGGESGVVAVQCLEGNEVWEAGKQGLWPRELAEAACAAVEDKPNGAMEDHSTNPAVFLLEHADGLRSAALMLNGYLQDWAYAGKIAGHITATECFLQPGGPGANFGYLCRNIQQFFRTGISPYPPERTLLTTGLIDAAMTSRHQGHQRLETPWLDIAYTSYDDMPLRPSAPRPCGASTDPAAPDWFMDMMR